MPILPALTAAVKLQDFVHYCWATWATLRNSVPTPRSWPAWVGSQTCSRAYSQGEGGRKDRQCETLACTPYTIGVKRQLHAGDLFLAPFFNQLGLRDICDKIANRGKFKFDLGDILAKLVYGRVLFPDSKLSTWKNAQNFIKEPVLNSRISIVHWAFSLANQTLSKHRYIAILWKPGIGIRESYIMTVLTIIWNRRRWRFS